jgi:chemotaxis regulatin CheY-phosphate phosphatase CheZ
MKIEDGFKAVDSIKNSSKKLSDSILRIEELEQKLAALETLTTDLKSLLAQASEVFLKLGESAGDLEAGKIKIAKAIDGLPALTASVVEKNLAKLVSSLETRMIDRLNQELKETRTTLRESHENSATNLEKLLEKTSQDIIAEMPKTIFGRRGRL